MIPKTIHYCWFSGEKEPRLIRKCLKSWKKQLKGYTVKCWDGKSLAQFMHIPFIKQAVELKKWAFVADYVRFYALYTEGGIYLDSDVEVFDNFDSLLDCEMFVGTDTKMAGAQDYGIEGAIMGASKGCMFLKKFLDYYEGKDCFMKPDGTRNCMIIPDLMASFFNELGYSKEDKDQNLDGGIKVFSTAVFRNSQEPMVINGKKPVAYHHNTTAWIPYIQSRGRIYNYCRSHDLLHIYTPLEKTIHKLLFWKY